MEVKEEIKKILLVLKKILFGERTGKFAADEFTGKAYEIESEGLVDIAFVTLGFLYLIAMFVFLGWQIIETFIGKNFIASWIDGRSASYLNRPLFKLITCAVFAGGLGGAINGIRTCIFWHPEKKGSSWRFIWKYLTLPLQGAFLAGIVYAFANSGIAVISGEFKTNGDFTIQAFTAFAIGAISGYGSHEGFKWLNARVHKLFKTIPAGKVIVPELKDQDETKAKELLESLKLKLGNIGSEGTTDEAKIGKVIRQQPISGLMITEGASVDVVMGKKKNNES